jgi:hypothetical protein
MYGIPSLSLAFLNLPIQATVLPFAPFRLKIEVLKGLARAILLSITKISTCKTNERNKTDM